MAKTIAEITRLIADCNIKIGIANNALKEALPDMTIEEAITKKNALESKEIALRDELNKAVAELQELIKE
jgi:hypothetical protein